jgi:hypothetical protein
MPNDWKRIEDTARYATVAMCGAWTAQASLSDGTIEGPMLFTRPGALASRADEKRSRDEMEKRMGHAVAVEVAKAFAGPVCHAWYRWAGDYVLAMPCFPSFAAVPAASAPPTPNAPFPLAAGLSLAPDALRPDRIEHDITGALGAAAEERGAREAVRRFTTWLAAGFESWAASTYLVGATGTGPVPMFAPPYVPVGPVVRGWLLAGGLLFGPTFAAQIPLPPGAPTPGGPWPPPGPISLPGFPGLPSFPTLPGLPALPSFPAFPLPQLPGAPTVNLPDVAGATDRAGTPSWPAGTPMPGASNVSVPIFVAPAMPAPPPPEPPADMPDLGDAFGPR